MPLRPKLNEALVLLCLALCLGCGGCDEDEFRDCGQEDISLLSQLPQRLSEAGLYADIEQLVVADGVLEFMPRYELWTDGAEKRRWLLLPPGTQVDASDADDWVFPVGTRVFKEFVRDGVRAETRVSLRTPTGWTAAAYIWNEAGTDAMRSDQGAANVLGTEHDVPGAAECLTCHGGRRGFVLGFAAVQFAPETREAFFDAGVLSERVPSEPQGDPVALRGLGVLHANCSHCHNATRDRQAQATSCYRPDTAYDFSLPIDLDDPMAAQALRTSRELWTGDEDYLVEIMASREDWSMPPLGTELVDNEGAEAVSALVRWARAHR